MFSKTETLQSVDEVTVTLINKEKQKENNHKKLK